MQKTPAPVYDLIDRANASQKGVSTQQLLPQIGESYRVNPGDTLFSIAWAYSIDHKHLAKINRIKNGKIYPGQRLILKQAVPIDFFSASSLVGALNREVLKTPHRITTQVKTSQSKSSYSTKRSSANKAKKYSQPKKRKMVSATKKSNDPNKVKTSSKKVSKKSTPKKKTPKPRQWKKSNNQLNWIWPYDGKLLAGFSAKNQANRGLDIAGIRGQPVRATAPGQVVYKGSGLRGYGNLVIIKHNNDYLSAYAHNETVHVSENEYVKAGQRIADIGRSGAKRDKLHFEIRYKGKPVDPLNYLPQK